MASVTHIALGLLERWHVCTPAVRTRMPAWVLVQMNRAAVQV